MGINKKDPNLILVIALTQEVNGKENKTEYSFHRSFRLVKEEKLIRTREISDYLAYIHLILNTTTTIRFQSIQRHDNNEVHYFNRNNTKSV